MKQNEVNELIEFVREEKKMRDNTAKYGGYAFVGLIGLVIGVLVVA